MYVSAEFVCQESAPYTSYQDELLVAFSSSRGFVQLCRCK
jgi:hypothetical protein